MAATNLLSDLVFYFYLHMSYGMITLIVSSIILTIIYHLTAINPITRTLRRPVGYDYLVGSPTSPLHNPSPSSRLNRTRLPWTHGTLTNADLASSELKLPSLLSTQATLIFFFGNAFHLVSASFQMQSGNMLTHSYISPDFHHMGIKHGN